MRKVFIHYHTGDQVITIDAPFAETKHPRGQPGNAGQFAKVPKHLELPDKAPLEMKLVHAKATNPKTSHEKKIESLKNVQGFAKWSKGAKAHAVKWLEHLQANPPGGVTIPTPKPPPPKHEPEVAKAAASTKHPPEPVTEKQKTIANAMSSNSLTLGGKKDYLNSIVSSGVMFNSTKEYAKAYAAHLGIELTESKPSAAPAPAHSPPPGYPPAPVKQPSGEYKPEIDSNSKTSIHSATYIADNPDIATKEQLIAASKKLWDAAQTVTGDQKTKFLESIKKIGSALDAKGVPSQSSPSAPVSAPASNSDLVTAPKGKAYPKNDGSAVIPAYFVNQGITAKSRIRGDQKLLRIQNIQKAMAAAKTAPSITSEEAGKLCPSSKSKWWKENSTPAARKAVYSYSGSGYGSINGALRNPDAFDSATLAQVNEIDELFENPDTIMKEDCIVHRGENVPSETIEKWKAALKAGKPMRAMREGFTSASLASVSAFSHKSVQFQILVRKGSRMLGIGVDGIAAGGTGENEIVLKHGISMEIYDITTGSDGRHFIKMAMVQ